MNIVDSKMTGGYLCQNLENSTRGEKRVHSSITKNSNSDKYLTVLHNNVISVFVSNLGQDRTSFNKIDIFSVVSSNSTILNVR